jgi:hypothetical protein
MSTEVRDTDSPHLRRELHLWEAVGISLALMAPSMAARHRRPFARALRVHRAEHHFVSTAGPPPPLWMSVTRTP